MRSSINIKANQTGFTLIELVVVIVILGILAVTAAPKFIDLTGDAKASVVQAVDGSLNSAADLAHAKALVAGVTTGPMSIAGQSIVIVNSYPNSATINLLMDVDGSDFTFLASGGVATYTHAKAASAAGCVASYTNATDEFSKPAIASITDLC
ncbi:type II secretion system protein [Colwellia piezophila]|uniref:type II secretion system protein n=1 Tax=Colwellia piezophila TaxID=211668 RepID=UPI00036551A4|nr:prepilin-type N-terminal cleavage/methylation domain-containing protein [Colwellia piezophila]